MKIDWKRKLTSRKLWLSIAGFVSGLIIIFGGKQDTADKVSGSIMAGAAIAVSGAIGFVGMMVPHVCRMLVGSDHKKVLPLSALLGGLLVIWTDVAARMVLAPEELPVGVLTAIIGGPCFIAMLKSKSGRLV